MMTTGIITGSTLSNSTISIIGNTTGDLIFVRDTGTGSSTDRNNGFVDTNAGMSSMFKGTIKEIAPGLYFRYIKSKLSALEIKNLTYRLKNMKYLLETVEETGQDALRDELQKQVAKAFQIQQAAACGYDKIVKLSTVHEFRNRVKDRAVDWCLLANFPRPIPKLIRDKIKEVKRKELFDELHVLFYNPSQEKLKSDKERIIEKDPILFGRFKDDPDTLFYICDWIDEVCDLTLDGFVEKVRQVDPEYKIEVADSFTEKEAKAIIDKVKAKRSALLNTNGASYRADAVLAELQDAKFSWKLVRNVAKGLWGSFKKKGKDTFSFTIGGSR